jgi:uncharacterized repeat protein (TIGR03803 family)
MKTAKVSFAALAVFVLLVSNLAWSATAKPLYTFFSATPQGVVFDAAGNLYGTTGQGGAYGHGSFFELSPSSKGWTQTVLYSFKGGADGSEPNGSLVFDAHGNLYGTTSGGGDQSCLGGCGVVFELTPHTGGRWTERVGYGFNGSPASAPEAGLIFDTAGNLYGTTYGSYSCSAGQCVGTAFELSPTSNGKWNIHILHQFGVIKNDGIGPLSVLAFDPFGNLYGTTYVGGVPNCGFAQSGCGTVFKFAPDSKGGWRYSVIWRFKGGADGDRPYAGVVSDRNGKYCSSSWPGCGTVFELLPNSNGTWTQSTIHTFAGYPKDGGSPQDGLVLDQAGNVFGTTISAGAFVSGTVFELSPQSSGWHETILYNFTPHNRVGSFPYGGLIVDSAGNLYGTDMGGNNSAGVAFEITLQR